MLLSNAGRKLDALTYVLLVMPLCALVLHTRQILRKVGAAMCGANKSGETSHGQATAEHAATKSDGSKASSAHHADEIRAVRRLGRLHSDSSAHYCTAATQVSAAADGGKESAWICALRARQ